MAYPAPHFATAVALARRRLLALGVAAALPGGAAAFSGAALAQAPAAGAADPLSRFEPRVPPAPVEDVTFLDAEGREVRLSAFRGKVVVVNFWATWCAPCVKEMPSLDRAQAALGSERFKVLALSLDGPQTRARAPRFYRDLGLANLELHFDAAKRAFQAFRVAFLPTTAILDRDGAEIGRLQGEAEWDTPPALALIRSALGPGG